MRYICEKCGKLITDDKLIRYLLEQRDRDGDLVVGYYAICQCGEKILIKKEKFLIGV